MNNKNQSPLKKLLGIRGMGAALTAFAGLIIIYIAFGLINNAVFSGQNILNLLRSMSKYLLIVYAGDIAAAVGLKNTTTGDTLCDAKHPIGVPPEGISPLADIGDAYMGTSPHSRNRLSGHILLCRPYEEEGRTEKHG